MVKLPRRKLAALAAASTVAGTAIAARAQTNDGGRGVQAAIARFAALPGASCQVIAEHHVIPWVAGHAATERRFVGSALKTFILARWLRDVEEGRLAEDRQMAVDDQARTLNSPVFLNLSGTTPAVSVLEAMITHSDNTATDIAMAAVGADRVRALIAEAGLKHTQIPDSMRKMFCYLAGEAEGADVGWPAVKKLVESPPNPRPALNDRQTMASTAQELVDWYRMVLGGPFFKKDATLVEFKRIQAMASALAQVVPPGIAAYGKGGSIDWQDFHCFCLPGQMVLNRVTVTFCFTINWTGPDSGVADTFKSYVAAVADVLREAARAVA